MKRSATRFLAAAALALAAQSTGAASLPLALTQSIGAFPPSARFAAAAAAPRASAAPSAKPRPARSGPSWLDSARVVWDYLLAQAEESMTPAPRPAPFARPARESFIPTAALPVPDEETRTLIDSASPAAPPADRMLVTMEPGTRVEAVLGHGNEDFSERPTMSALAIAALPTWPAFRERWLENGGLRARLTYLRPHGSVKGGADGFAAVFADGHKAFARNPGLAPGFRREFPIYWHGELVSVEFELQNRTERTMRGVRLQAVQESFRPVGTEGTRVAPPIELAVGDLAPGAKKTVRWTMSLIGPAHDAVNLEQTHVVVTSADASGAALLDAPQAGAIDPPGPGLL